MRLTPMHDERGSIPLALLSIIALSSIVGALVVSTVANANATRFSDAYLDAVQVADKGAQEGVQRLIRATTPATRNAVTPRCTTTARTSCTARGGTIPASGIPAAGTFDGSTYTWIAERIDPQTWEVRSTATAQGDVARTVVIEARELPRFGLAAFSDESWTAAGANAANSYDASGYGSGGSTGAGIIASNGYVTLNGMSTTVDGVHLYNWDTLPYVERCDASGGTGCNDVRSMPTARHPSARIGAPLSRDEGGVLNTDFIDQQLTLAVGTPGACQELPPPERIIGNAGASIGASGVETTLCYNNLTIRGPVTVLGRTRIFVYGDLSVGNHVEINCAGCTATSTPDASRLSFYLKQGAVRVGTGVELAAAIFAPNSECGGNPASSNTHFFGSLVCRRIVTQGGWAFHYDERLRGEGSGVYEQASWREE